MHRRCCCTMARMTFIGARVPDANIKIIALAAHSASAAKTMHASNNNATRQLQLHSARINNIACRCRLFAGHFVFAQVASQPRMQLWMPELCKCGCKYSADCISIRQTASRGERTYMFYYTTSLLPQPTLQSLEMKNYSLSRESQKFDLLCATERLKSTQLVFHFVRLNVK